MAKFLNTTGVSYYLEQLINTADEKLILISPYLKINEKIKQSLEDKNRLKIEIRVVYGKNELQPDENNWLKSMSNIKTSFCKDLHAKCYLNENVAIITSMNLYEFSQVNNNEMGIYIEKSKDPDLYKDIYDESRRLIRSSDEIVVSVEKVSSKEKQFEIIEKIQRTEKKPNSKKNGHCIRCNKSIKLNPLVPYCKDCYKIWNKYGDEEYPEEFCHVCGTEKGTSMLKPTCYPCFKANKNKLEFSL